MSSPARHTSFALILFSIGVLLIVAELFGDEEGSGWLDGATQTAARQRADGDSAHDGGDSEDPRHRVVAVGTRSAWADGGEQAFGSDSDAGPGRFSPEAELIDTAEGFDPSPARDEPGRPAGAPQERQPGDVESTVN